ncbi:hypothetical protein [Serratia marcescens]|uniref:hypothetical protein n=1 Tax=Serratia marcescens TaxID=615 RepID=UPI0012FD8CA6|nr:hypothetical protein [Serratia marcescens]WGL90408.1 hypothetical protein QFB85_18635 [Serratia marcescens]
MFLIGYWKVSLNKRAADHQNAPLHEVVLFFLRQKALHRSMGFNTASKVPDDSPCVMINTNAPPFFCRYAVNEKYRPALMHNSHTIYGQTHRVKRRIQTASSSAAPPILNKLAL